jgi:hypothetical protein
MNEEGAGTDFGRYIPWLIGALEQVAGNVISPRDGVSPPSSEKPKGYWPQLRYYWGQAARDFRYSLRMAWPVFAGLTLFVPASATALYFAERNADKTLIKDWWEALYFTWVTMATVDNAHAADLYGRLLTSLDVLMGLLTVGVIVWLITTSLDQNSTEERLVTVIESLQPSVVSLIEGIRPSIEKLVASFQPAVAAPATLPQVSGAGDRPSTNAPLRPGG